jgi:hypothetical protein
MIFTYYVVWYSYTTTENKRQMVFLISYSKVHCTHTGMKIMLFAAMLWDHRDVDNSMTEYRKVTIYKQNRNILGCYS